MIVREKFHASRSAETARAYADAAIAAPDFGNSPREATLVAVAAELTHAGFDDDAARVAI